MKKLIVCRHADHLPNGDLTRYGLDRTVALSERIRDLIGDPQTIVVASSTAVRAVRTAEILAGALEPTVVLEFSELSIDNGGVAGSLKVIDKTLEVYQPDVLVLVSHLNLSEAIATAFAKERLDLDIRTPEHGLDKSTGILIDLETKKVRRV